jgi:hypothetical protein
VSNPQARGDASPRATSPTRGWSDRLADADEPLYTIAVVADLLVTDTQTLRRLEATLARESARPSGNQRRYSRRDIEALDDALRLVREGHPPQSVVRILQLERLLEK